jgi:hypothetical protein
MTLKNTFNVYTTTPNVDDLRDFINTALTALAEHASGMRSIEDAALKISAAGISVGLSESEQYPDLRRIVELAFDLEVPGDAYQGDYDGTPEQDWQRLVAMVNQAAKKLLT